MRMNFRMRFACTIHRSATSKADDHLNTYQILNDLVVDRGNNSIMSQLELLGNDKHITTVQADGLAVATPTGKI